MGPPMAAGMIRSRLSRLAPALAAGLLMAAPAHAATRQDAAPAATVVKSFKPLSVKGSTMLFRVKALAPERVVRARLFAGGHGYEVKVSVVRDALRRKGLIRTRLTSAVAARVRRARRTKPAYRFAHLAIYLRRNLAAAPKKKATTPAKTKSSTTATG